MALAKWVADAQRPSQLVTWTRHNPGEADDGSVENLTGATITGKIRLHGQSTSQAIAGALVLTDAANGVFRWDYAAGDVAVAGEHEVQFTATFGSGQTPAKTFVAEWEVSRSL